MSRTNIPLESEVVTWLLKLIEGEELVEAIQGQERIEQVTGGVNQDYFIPSFSIDYISRRASAEAAKHVLDRLGLLDVISVDTSISLTSGEVLRPDILSFNPESRTLVVFEVKRAKDTERQTVTELAGYEQELRNLLPFLGSFDICFVIVAADWSTLLTHAVGSMNAWSGKQCLALRLSETESSLSVEVHLPEAWHLTGSVQIPPQALQSIDLYLVEDEIDVGTADKGEGDQRTKEERWPPRIVLTAMDVIARAGDRAGSHGFMMLWRDVHGFGRGKWCLTLCAIDPYAMYAWCREHGLSQRSSEISEFLHERRGDLEGQTPTTVYDIAKAAFPLLRELYDPEFSGDYCWQQKTRELRCRAVPTRFDFWGSLGQHAREFVCNPSVRNWYMPYLSFNQMDWTDPSVALPLIENLSHGVPFPGGVIKCSDAFAVGRVLGDLAVAAFNASPDREHAAKIEPLVEWTQLEALRFAVEMKQMYDVAEEVTTSMPVLSNDPYQRFQATQDLADWVSADLIGGRHPFHQACFDLGFREALLFTLGVNAAAEMLPSEQLTHVALLVRKLLKGALRHNHSSQGRALQRPAYIALVEYLKPYINLVDDPSDEEIDAAVDAMDNHRIIESFPDEIVKGIDSIVPVVLHTARPAYPGVVDWEWLQSGARAMFEAGDLWPAVILTQDGMIGSGYLEEGLKRCLVPVSDPAVEVYVLDESSRLSITVKKTWPELKEFYLARRTQADN
jgi:hypothetical protein